MKNVLFFASATRQSCRKRLDGVFRYFKGSGVRVQVIERDYHEVPVRKLLDFWKPNGCIAECGSGADELKQSVFGSIPVVYIDVDPHKAKTVSYAVLADCPTSGMIAAKELLQLGAENFGFVGYKTPYYWSEQRREAFTAALELNGRKCNVFNDRSKGDEVKRIRDMRDWLAVMPKPCAIFTAMDPVSEEVLGVCADLKLSIPDDVMILGVDNDEDICEHTKPTLSSLEPDFDQAGYLAAEILALRMANPKFKPCTRSFGIVGVVHRQSTYIYQRRDTRVMKAVEFIRQNACKGILVADVVKAMGCSRRLAEMRYREITGSSIKEAIEFVRIERVKSLLRSGAVSIGAMAANCGYADSSTLRKAFHKKTGLSMREWRKKN